MEIHELKEMIHWHSSASGCPPLGCTAIQAVRNEIFWRLLDLKVVSLSDSQDGYPVIAPIVAWYGARYVPAKLN